MTVLEMPGLALGPMGNWLAAAGVLRMLARADRDARLRWDGDVPAITAALPAPERDLADRITFTPVLTPWQSGGGWGAKDKTPATRLEAMRASSSPRLAATRAAIMAADAVAASHPDAGKDDLVRLLRNSLPDEALPWLDAVVPLRPAGWPDRVAVAPAPLAGTGGNDARWDLSTTYHAAVLDLGPDREAGADGTTADPAIARRRGLLADLLYGTSHQPLPEMSTGPYWPDRGDGRLANPWQAVLLAEGLCAFGDSPRTFVPEPAPWTSAPGPELDADDSPGEAWLPLWGEPMTMPEVALLLGGPQPRWRGKGARTPAQMLSALRSGGWPAGVTGYARYGLARRRGQGHAAVPLDIVLPESVTRLTVVLTAAQSAGAAGIRESTFRSYVARGQAPGPDARDLASGRPGWCAATIGAWLASRPGAGARTDLE
jgi:CRISPR-associated protein Csx17